jgi:hypothetical protein
MFFSSNSITNLLFFAYFSRLHSQKTKIVICFNVSIPFSKEVYILPRQIVDFNASVPSNFSQSLNRPIPQAPANITLAAFGLAVLDPGTDVLLIGNVEIASLLGIPQIVFRIFRNTAVIGTVRVETLAVNEVRNVTFQIVDLDAPVGYHSYKITAEVTNTLLNQAAATGPITFSGTSIL